MANGIPPKIEGLWEKNLHKIGLYGLSCDSNSVGFCPLNLSPVFTHG
jgi:hypothetical protein